MEKTKSCAFFVCLFVSHSAVQIFIWSPGVRNGKILTNKCQIKLNSNPSWFVYLFASGETLRRRSCAVVLTGTHRLCQIQSISLSFWYVCLLHGIRQWNCSADQDFTQYKTSILPFESRCKQTLCRHWSAVK